MNTQMKIKISALAFMASLAVSFANPAHAQYTTNFDSNINSNFGSNLDANLDESFDSSLTSQSINVQDYNIITGINDTTSYGQDHLSSSDILNGMFDGFIGVFGACIGVPAIIIAILQLFVRRQSQSVFVSKPAQVFLNPIH